MTTATKQRPKLQIRPGPKILTRVKPALRVQPEVRVSQPIQVEVNRRTPTAENNAIIRAIEVGPENGVKERLTKVINAGLREAAAEPGEDRFKKTRGNPQKRFLSLVRKAMQRPIMHRGRLVSRYEAAAEVFVEQTLLGEFPFHKELMERDEGKVTQPVSADVAVKHYVGLPVGDDPEAP